MKTIPRMEIYVRWPEPYGAWNETMMQHCPEAEALVAVARSLCSPVPEECRSVSSFLSDSLAALDKALAALDRKARQTMPPYGEWCRKPEACRGKGYCPLAPTCGD